MANEVYMIKDTGSVLIFRYVTVCYSVIRVNINYPSVTSLYITFQFFTGYTNQAENLPPETAAMEIGIVLQKIVCIGICYYFILRP